MISENDNTNTNTNTSKPFKLTKSKERKMAEIIALGYEKQNKVLTDAGFHNLSRNRKYLVLNDGDVDKTILALKEKKQAKEDRAKVRAEKRDNKKEGGSSHPGEKYMKGKRKSSKDDNDNDVKVETKEYNKIPDNITTIYLDGNNMLFAENTIRKITLKRKKRDAEKTIAGLAHKLIEAHGKLDIELVYDHTSLDFTTKLNKDTNILHVFSSGKYGNSDDALVDWAKNMDKEKLKNMIFVTSDRELQRRLTAEGVIEIVKPGAWFKLVKATIGEDAYAKAVTEFVSEEQIKKDEAENKPSNLDIADSDDDEDDEDEDDDEDVKVNN